MASLPVGLSRSASEQNLKHIELQGTRCRVRLARPCRWGLRHRRGDITVVKVAYFLTSRATNSACSGVASPR